jgi:hypothetical protein
MVFVNKKTYLSIFSIFFIYACQIDNNVNLDNDLQEQVIDENIVFEQYLSNLHSIGWLKIIQIEYLVSQPQP